jgi:hypothetical protein
MPNSIVDFRNFGNVEVLGLLIIEILFELRPSTVNQNYTFTSFLGWNCVAFTRLDSRTLFAFKIDSLDLLYKIFNALIKVMHLLSRIADFFQSFNHLLRHVFDLSMLEIAIKNRFVSVHHLIQSFDHFIT